MLRFTAACGNAFGKRDAGPLKEEEGFSEKVDC